MKYVELKEIAVLITKGEITTIVIALCIAILLIYFGARILKNAELAEIKSNFEDIKNQQIQLTNATENIKSEVSKKTIEYQIKLNSYNQKKIDAIDIVYKELIKLKQAAKTVALNYEKKNREIYLACVDSFRNEHEINKLWIPNEVSDIFELVAIEIDNKTNPFILIRGAEDLVRGQESDYWLSMPDEKFEKNAQIIDDFHDFISKEAEAKLKEAIKSVSNSLTV